MSTSIPEIIASLEDRGVRFRIQGQEVKARIPKNSPELWARLELLRPHRDEVRTLLESKGLAPCASANCGGCYEVESGKQIHPPKASRDWLDWLEQCQPKGRTQ